MDGKECSAKFKPVILENATIGHFEVLTILCYYTEIQVGGAFRLGHTHHLKNPILVLKLPIVSLLFWQTVQLSTIAAKINSN